MAGHVVNYLGGRLSETIGNYMNPSQCNQEQKSTEWSEPSHNPYFNQHEESNYNTNSRTGWSRPQPNAERSSQSNSNENQGQQSCRGQDAIGNIFQMMNKEKPKDAKGWIEFGIQSFAEYNRDKKK